jgi:hypothetical protein
MSAYLLPCDCGTDIVVTAAQAGGSATCPACGRAAAVPRFRELSALPRATSAPARASSGARRPWRIGHTLLLVGALATAGCTLGSMSFQPPAMEWVSSEKIRSSVMQAATDEVYTMMRTRLVPSGVERPPTADESKMRARTDFYAGIRDGLRTAAAIGAGVALLGGLLLLLDRKAPPGRRT